MNASQRLSDMETVRIAELNQKIKLCAKEMEEARRKLFQIEGKKKIAYIKQHLGEWFWNGDSYMKPLKVNGKNIWVLSAGEYDGNPYMEFEEIAWQNLNLEKNRGPNLPKDVKRILEVILKTIKADYLKKKEVDV